mmetsp:Transcript_27657/g.60489  ORF Transcript_27657/g.60489 Transcript_27657/m.60489 type:complete len:338 (-) Transcript_27657:137-1150(-)
MRAAREARLAALERRGLGGPAEAPAPAVQAAPPQTAPPQQGLAASGAAAVAAQKPLEGKQKKIAEKEEILKRIAEEREEKAARLGSAAGAAASGNADSGAPRPPAATPAESGGATPSHPLSGPRVPGQLGDKINKAERARERELILKQLATDRENYSERQGATTAAAASEAAAGGGPQPYLSSVRLQIRCAQTGRAITTTAFDSKAALRSVRDFAAEEFNLQADGDAAPQLILAYPPRTTFSTEEQLSTSLADLELCPSATMIMRRPDGMAAALPAESSREEASVTSVSCPRGHSMTVFSMPEDAWCDKCQESLAAGAECYQCCPCDYIQCRPCSGH